MPDRLGQERDKKRSKTLLTIAGVLIALNVLIFLFVPTQRSISYDEDALRLGGADSRNRCLGCGGDEGLCGYHHRLCHDV